MTPITQLWREDIAPSIFLHACLSSRLHISACSLSPVKAAKDDSARVSKSYRIGMARLSSLLFVLAKCEMTWI
jgi:hypothetical protein